MFNQGIYSLISEMNSMPVLTIWCAICPKNLEATSITLFTGISNLSYNMSNYFGVGIMWLLGIGQKNLNKIWILITIQNIYLLVIITGILFVKFPNPNETVPVDLELKTYED